MTRRAAEHGTNPVVVALNNAVVQHTIRVDLDGFSGLAAVQPIRTSVTEDWVQPAAIPVSISSFTATLPARGVTTFVPASAVPHLPT